MLKRLVILLMLSHQALSMEKEDGVAGNVGNWSNIKTVEFPEDFQEKVNRLKEENQRLKQQFDQHQLILTQLQQRIIVLENKEGGFAKIKKYIPNPFNYFNYYGLLGAVVALSSISSQYFFGCSKFNHTSVSEIGKDLVIVAVSGGLASQVGNFIDDGALFPIVFGCFGGAIAEEAFNITSGLPRKWYHLILPVTTTVFTGFGIYGAYLLKYGDPK